ncbi:MerR family DNA-binding transcriptional regulator [Pseudonocardia sp. HH130630-07]|uniref:MerR family DNA-binding transcriptional regulator n=1 Tax=Pseudonocardia sp. HH130630-07 TaxID=1690815 RepID=UPI000814EC28|nr:MerR family DNA-binding transcriptional regulator [Pseudonocardia sp. HH130630-07]ANY05538.1 MerR family transcriptional regulator [Pseudonocardia sp. HH130630-07]
MLIGEVSRRSGISARMLRHYDAIGLVRPSGRTLGGYREYSEADVRRLFHVEGLRALGMGLPDVAEALGDLSFDPTALVERLVARTRDRIARDEELLRRLGRVRGSDPADWTDVLRTTGLLRGLEAADPSARQRLALSLTGGATRDAELLAEATLSEPDPVVAGALDWAVARAGDDAVAVLADALDAPDADRRHRALTALLKIGSPRALSVLAEAFRHADPLVARRATLVRGTLGLPDTVAALVDMVVDGPDDVEAAEVLGTLASTQHRGAEVAAAIAEALTGAEVSVRLRLTTALAEVPGPEADAVLTDLVADADRRVALTAGQLLRVRPDGG